MMTSRWVYLHCTRVSRHITGRHLSSLPAPCHAHCLWKAVRGTACQEARWGRSILDRFDKDTLLKAIEHKEEKEDARLPPLQSGTYFKEMEEDLNYMTDRHTAPVLAAGVRGYDHLLQRKAKLLEQGEDEKLLQELKPYEKTLFENDDEFTPQILDEGEKIEFDGAMGVHNVDYEMDVKHMLENYTAVALAQAIRIRCERLQFCAKLAEEGNMKHLHDALKPFTRDSLEAKRNRDHQINWKEPLLRTDKTLIRKILTAVPRRVGFAHLKRSAVVLPICQVYGVPSLLFQLRSKEIPSYKDQVCFPGGKVDSSDTSIFFTGIREMEEEVHGVKFRVEVIAGLRCPWEEIQAFSKDTFGVTPVVGWVGEVGGGELCPKTRESSEIFTVPLSYLLDDDLWERDRDRAAPVFLGGPREIFGITGYILDQFVKTVMKPLATDKSRNPTIFYR